MSNRDLINKATKEFFGRMEWIIVGLSALSLSTFFFVESLDSVAYPKLKLVGCTLLIASLPFHLKVLFDCKNAIEFRVESVGISRFYYHILIGLCFSLIGFWLVVLSLNIWYGIALLGAGLCVFINWNKT
ncbi:hypothetical protein GNP57_18240 [Aliivibrio fischeri]|uniref:hypothetical protein n=1 Tax=Aliivibrio fischeri TaxID=668 RepID=UPI0012DAF51D|nr:hypothetical protein [Aliivibrio fischeri]MUL15446.1 hypothetical protein [Aliivibrio fischeri]